MKQALRSFSFLFQGFFFTAFALINSEESFASTLRLDQIKLPPGFRISLYASDVEGARSLALSPNGALFVGTRAEGKVYAILDTNRDYKADRIITIASGLNMPNGVAFRDGSLFVAEVNRVLRFDK